MKILVITGIFPPDIGGPATYSDLLRHELGTRGFFVQVLTYSEKNFVAPIFSVSKKWPKGLRHFLFFIKLFYLALGNDLILAADAGFGSGFLAAIVSKILHKKFIVRVTGDYAWEQGVARFGVKDLLDDFRLLENCRKYSLAVRTIAKLQAWTVGVASIVIVPSEYLKRITIGWGVDGKKIEVIYNGIKLPSVVESREDLRKKFNFDGPTIISVGRLVPWKGFDMLIEAFGEVLKILPKAKLLIIGDGLESEKIKMQIAKYKDQIKLLNKMSQSELFQYIKAADIFALSTAYEGFSHQLVEVLGLGVPVITTNVGGNSEIIINGENGILVPYNDKEKLKNNLINLLKDEVLRNKFIENGLATAKKFTDEKMISELIKVINNL